MDFIRIGLYTKDEDYGLMLAKRLTQFYSRFFVTILTEDMLADPDFREQYDLVLIDGLKEPLKGKYIGLVASPGEVMIKEETLEYKLYKYGNVREIVKNLLFIYGKVTGHKAVYLEKQKTRIISFVGSRGGVGTTSVAKSTANYLTRFKEKKVLFISLDEILFQEPNPNQKGLDEFLYHYREGRPTATYLESYMLENIWGTWRFNSKRGINPMNELDSEDLAKLIGFIIHHGSFEYICIDGSQRFSKREEALFRIAHKVVLVYGLDRDKEDICLLENYFSHFEGSDCLGSIIHVGNKFDYGSMLDQIEYKKYSYILDYDLDSFVGKNEDEPSLDLDFGKGIKLLSIGLT